RGGGVVGKEGEAEDVTQDVLLQVVRKLHTFRGESALTSWLHRVTVNAAISLQRKRAVHREQQLGAEAGRCVEDRHPPGRAGVGRPDEQAQTEELSRLIVKAIDNLPHPYRQGAGAAAGGGRGGTQLQRDRGAAGPEPAGGQESAAPSPAHGAGGPGAALRVRPTPPRAGAAGR